MSLRQGTLGRSVCLSVLFAGAGCWAETTDVFFVGNSYTATFNVPAVFKDLAASGGHAVETTADIIGGAELAQHGSAAGSIARGNYDFVVLQEASTMPYKSEILSNFKEQAPLLHQAATNSGAQVVLYMAWVRESQWATQKKGTEIYRDMARQLNCKLAPVAESWQRLMDQKPDLDPFCDDRHHQSEAGTYLAACNFYGTIFNESPEGLPFRTVGGKELSAADAALLQRIAWDAVQFVTFANPPEISSLRVDKAVRIDNTPFTFTVSAFDNGSIVDYMWDFGDGTTTNGPSLNEVAHVYASDGVFPVTVKVTDDSGETERTGLYVTRDAAGPRPSDIAATRTALTVQFNQALGKNSAEESDHYTVSGGVSVLGATQTAPDTVRLDVSPLAAGVDYVLTLNHLASARGTEVVPNTTAPFMYVDGSGMHLRFDFGKNTSPTPGNWNNITAYGGDLVVTNAIDIYGVKRPINLRFIPATAANIKYVSGGEDASDLYPNTAQRDCIYYGSAFSYRIEGADPASQYRLTFFASKHAETRETLFTVGNSNAVLDCAYNTDRTVVFEGVQPDANGNIVFKVAPNVENSSGLAYLSVLELEDMTTSGNQSIETSASALAINEGTTNSFNVRLSAKPAGDVTVSANHVSGDAHVQVLSTSAFTVFTPENWNVWQPIHVEALTDVDTESGVAMVECAAVGSVYSSAKVQATQVEN